MLADGHSSQLMGSSLLPVTAVCPRVSSPLVFVACGNFLQLFNHGVRVWSLPVFGDQTIHGIALTPLSDGVDLLLIHGGHRVRLACVDRSSLLATFQKRPTLLDDWLLHAAFPPSASGLTLQAVGLTAHNKLLLFRVRVDAKSSSTISYEIYLDVVPLTGASNSLLYVARLQWLAPSHVLIVAGSAFGDLLVWSCFLHATVGLAIHRKCAWHFFWEAHQGSVFGIDIYRNEQFLLAASCSDERTIKVWDISVVLSLSSLEFSLLDGPELSSDAELARSAAPLIASTWAHASRIWNTCFLAVHFATSKLSQVHLASSGEDGTCQYHLLAPNSGSQATKGWTSDSKTWLSHAGKNIWSLAVQKTPFGSAVFTGGADGSVISYACPSHPERTREPDQSFGLAALLSQAAKFRLATQMKPSVSFPRAASLAETAPALSKDAIRAAIWLSEGSEILCLTNFGHMLLGRRKIDSSQVSSSTAFEWKTTSLPASLKGYSVASPLAKSSGLALFADASNEIHLLNTNSVELKSLSQAAGKVSKIFTSDLYSAAGSQGDSVERCYFFYLPILMSHSQHTPALHRVGLAADLSVLTTDIVARLQIHGQVTSVLLKVLSRDLVLLHVGSRYGYFAHYNVVLGTEDIINPISSDKLHQDSITSIQHLTHDVPHDSGEYMLLTCRDSTISVIRNSEFGTKEIQHTVIPACGPFVEGAFFARHTNHLCLYGFRGYDFVVYDEIMKREVAVIRCGGSARIWAFHPPSASAGHESTYGQFLFVRAKELHLARLESHEDLQLQVGGHGREIKACAVSPRLLDMEGQVHQLMATGAEDTDLRLFARNAQTNSTSEVDFKCLAILKQHNTGIQHLQWSNDGSYLFSSGGMSEFCVWRVRQIPVFTTGIVCEFSFKESHNSDSQDLRIMSFDVRHANDDMDSFDICVALSDSNIKVYRYSCTRKSWVEKWASSYTEICLTQALFLWPDDTKCVAAATTDGHLVVWHEQASRGSFASDYTHSLRVHQSSIKGLARLPLRSKDGKRLLAMLIVTSSDDNSISLTLVHTLAADSAEAASPRYNMESLTIPRAHSASISAINILPVSKECLLPHDERYTTIRLVTGGNDQRLKTWDVSFSADSPSISSMSVVKVSNSYTPIADVGDMDILTLYDQESQRPSIDVLVCGVGMQSVAIPQF